MTMQMPAAKAARRSACGAVLAILAAIAAVPEGARAEAPLSANDWLAGSGTVPRNLSSWRPGDPIPEDAQRLRPDIGAARPPPRPGNAAEAIADSAAAVPVGVSRLDGTNPDALGIISARQAAVPLDLWEGLDTAQAARLLAAETPRIPAAARLFRRVIEAQLNPPAPAEGEAAQGSFFLARVDRLLDLGALPIARDMLNAAGPGGQDRFARVFAVALLLGDEANACRLMDEAPGIARDFPARIFCLAVKGDWPAASLTYQGAGALGLLDPMYTDLLTDFLDDSSADDGTLREPPPAPSPLIFRLHEAIGQPLPTAHLPLAFAWSELRVNAGWKAQLDAAERLARADALAPPTLHRLYTAQRPAASGSVWERAAAIQALDAALLTDDPARIGPALRVAHRQLDAAGLRDSFARIYAEQLDPADLSGEAARLALWLRLWAGVTELRAAPEAEIDLALLALASGESPEAIGAELTALGPIFAESPAPAEPARAAPLFEAIRDADAAVDGDLARAARGIAALREMGLWADARRIATQIALDPLLSEAAHD
ncbi:MAG: hypothetical protein Q4F71_03795 [Paracoccus sp. (in: a-proteobacteria)]|nr:hypothetical protein [Paracoccus sp. (in: a-proteobacteria)]